MKYGLITGDTWFEMDGKSQRIPVPEVELAKGGAPREASFREYFPYHDNETAIAFDALSSYYFQWGDLLTGIKMLVDNNMPTITRLRDQLQRPEMVKLLAPKVKAYLGLVDDARSMAQDGLEFVDIVRDRAIRLPKPKSDLEITTRAIELSTIRQEIGTMDFTKLNERERTNKVLSRVGKGDLENDLHMLEAVRRTNIFEPDGEAFNNAGNRLITAHYPWINDLAQQKESIAHWVRNRTTYEAIPALNKVLPMGLTAEKIIELTTEEKPKDNLTERMKNAA